MTKLLDGIVEHVDRIKTLADFNRPSFRLVYFDECEEYVEPVAFVGALWRAPVGVDLGERGPMIFVSSDWPEFHRQLLQNCDMVKASTRAYSAGVPMNFTKATCRRKSKATTKR